MIFPNEKQRATINRFTYRIPDGETKAKMRAIRIKTRELAMEIEKFCPDCSQKETALSQLFLVMAMVNSSIVSECPIDPDDL